MYLHMLQFMCIVDLVENIPVYEGQCLKQHQYQPITTRPQRLGLLCKYTYKRQK